MSVDCTFQNFVFLKACTDVAYCILLGERQKRFGKMNLDRILKTSFSGCEKRLRLEYKWGILNINAPEFYFIIQSFFKHIVYNLYLVK